MSEEKTGIKTQYARATDWSVLNIESGIIASGLLSNLPAARIKAI
jgi:hypothetical protein